MFTMLQNKSYTTELLFSLIIFCRDRVMQSTDQHIVEKAFILNSTDLAPIY